MAKILIDVRDNSVHDKVADGEEFLVASTGDLVWVDEPTGLVDASTHDWDGVAFVEKPPYVPPVVLVDVTPGTTDILKLLYGKGAIVAGDLDQFDPSIKAAITAQ
jgi:hypothetical protein